MDTVREADLIVLASRLGETGLAKELLGFYWTKSQGGQTALHAAYDAKAQEMARRFAENFKQFAGTVAPDVAAAGPRT